MIEWILASHVTNQCYNNISLQQNYVNTRFFNENFQRFRIPFTCQTMRLRGLTSDLIMLGHVSYDDGLQKLITSELLCLQWWYFWSRWERCFWEARNRFRQRRQPESGRRSPLRRGHREGGLARLRSFFELGSIFYLRKSSYLEKCGKWTTAAQTRRICTTFCA